jgi:hypothetical protein
MDNLHIAISLRLKSDESKNARQTCATPHKKKSKMYTLGSVVVNNSKRNIHPEIMRVVTDPTCKEKKCRNWIM